MHLLVIVVVAEQSRPSECGLRSSCARLQTMGEGKIRHSGEGASEARTQRTLAIGLAAQRARQAPRSGQLD